MKKKSHHNHGCRCGGNRPAVRHCGVCGKYGGPEDCDCDPGQ